jgi:hypothetical protein
MIVSGVSPDHKDSDLFAVMEGSNSDFLGPFAAPPKRDEMEIKRG